MDDVEEIIKTKKNAFETWPEMVLMRVSDKGKYGELIADLPTL